MRRWVLAAGLLAAAAPPALAADIDDEPPPIPKSGVYERFAPKVPPPPPGYDYEDDDFDGPPPAKKYTDAPPYGPPPKKFTDAPPYGKACVRSEEVRERLTNHGWHDFHAGQPAGQVVTLRARRPSGRLFELTLHRCSGQIVDARPLEPRPHGPYAFARPPGPEPRWGWRPYRYDGPWYERPYAYRWRRWYRD
jgi:hypothetical protein